VEKDHKRLERIVLHCGFSMFIIIIVIIINAELGSEARASHMFTSGSPTPPLSSIPVLMLYY
jgi:hypothetical protein